MQLILNKKNWHLCVSTRAKFDIWIGHDLAIPEIYTFANIQTYMEEYAVNLTTRNINYKHAHPHISFVVINIIKIQVCIVWYLVYNSHPHTANLKSKNFHPSVYTKANWKFGIVYGLKNPDIYTFVERQTYIQKFAVNLTTRYINQNTHTHTHILILVLLFLI